MASSRTRQPVRVFIDSSVFIAAAISPSGSARELLFLGLNKELVLSVSSLVLEETERNLSKKAPQALTAFRLVEATANLGVVEPSRAQVLRAARVVDIKDAPIVAGAVRARAEYLATYDRRHLLSARAEIQAAFGVTTATPDEVISGGTRTPANG